MKKFFSQCIAAYLIASLAFGYGVVGTRAYADDYWGDFDASLPLDAIMPDPVPPEPAPAPDFDSQTDTGFWEGFTPAPDPAFDEFTAPAAAAGESEDPSLGYGDFDLADDYVSTPDVDQSSIDFIRVVRHPRKAPSDYQNAIIEGLQVSVEENPNVAEEVLVTCYFIFRDKPSSYFFDINRKEKKLVFEFVDTRTGSSPIAALSQSPLREIVIDELQVDANKDIKGLNPEWHDMIRITFHLNELPVVSVTDESSIISFRYKWTTNPEKVPQYLETDRFPLVFWLSGGVLGAIGIGTLTYFLLPKKEPDTRLKADDLPARPSTPTDRAQGMFRRRGRR